MARRARLTNDVEQDQDVNATFNPIRGDEGRVNSQSLSPSPAASFSSDKENRQTPAGASRQAKSKRKSVETPRASTSTMRDQDATQSSKRRRLSERNTLNASQATHARQLDEVTEKEFYDPEQEIGERRAVRKEFRDLSKELTDSRAEYLAPGSKGLLNTITKANELFTSVKQTSDATLDSRLLVSTADLSAKRTTQLSLGDSTTGIDVDDFVGKCISFMRRAPADRSGASRRDEDSEEEGAEEFDEGDAFNWEWLGRQACFPNNVRPPVPGFLLGPLSVQKKVRKATQRRERLQRQDPRDATRPEEMKAQDFSKSANSDLTTLCTRIRELLVRTQVEGQKKVADEMTDDISDEDARELLTKHGVADDEGVPFFHFVMNPKSFGQTVENLFYVSFLIKEGKAAIGNDTNMLPTIHASIPRTKDEIQDQNISKHQAVFHLDFETWEDILETFSIKECIIPHRHSEEEAQPGASGWYG